MGWLTILVLAVSLLGSVCSKKLPFDRVVPFAEVRNNTSIKNALALKFKPQLHISSGCHPYPAVNAGGYTNAGLRIHRLATDCEGSPLGSQVYGRMVEIEGRVGVMYAWYFPRDFLMPIVIAHRHSWEHVFVWLSSFSDDAKLLSVKVPSVGFSYFASSLPRNDQMDGNHVKLKYKSWLPLTSHHLTLTDEAGKYQDLIMWDDMTKAAREALEHTQFFFRKAPISTSKFKRYAQEAYPF